MNTNKDMNTNKEDCKHCALKQSDQALFSDVPLAYLDTIKHCHQDLPIKSKIYLQNEKSPFIYTLKYGIVKLSTTDSKNIQTTTALAKKGMVLGIEILNNNSYMQDAVALTPIGICKIEISLKQIQSDEILNKNLFLKWQESYSHQTLAFKDFTTGSTIDKILKLLRYMTSNTNDEEEFYMLSLDDISSIVRVSRENCSRVLAKLKRNNLMVVNQKEHIYKFKSDLEDQ